MTILPLTVFETWTLMGLIVTLVCLAGVATGCRMENKKVKAKVDTWA